MVGIQQTFHVGLYIREIGQCLTVIIGQLAGSRHLTFEILFGKHQSTVDEVS